MLACIGRIAVAVVVRTRVLLCPAAHRRVAEFIAQGRELLWSTGESALRVAIMETIRCCSESAAAEASLSSREQGAADDDQRRLLMDTSSCLKGQQENFQ